MLASKLIESLKFKKVEPASYGDFEVSAVTQDTREVSQNSVFIAIVGSQIDGHTLVAEAVKKGAAMIIAQKKVDCDNVPVVYVENTNRAMAILSDCFYDSPSKAMRMIGVTGTNGKTTVTHIIEEIFREQGEKTGLIGTMYRRIGDKIFPTKNTTPDIITLQRTLSKMHKQDVSSVAMEVSSIALVQGRVWGIDFDIAVFTNLTRDHLDYHKTMANYAHAKSLLFSQLGNEYGFKKNSKVAILNIDDPMGRKLEEDTSAPVLTYGIKHEAMIKASNVVIHSQGTDFDLSVFDQKQHLKVKMVGLFNVYNILASFAAAYAAGLDPSKIISVLSSFKGVKGRLQLIPSSSGVSAIVDYSHTPDGLLNALETINDFAKGKVFCIIGCGGDRDHGKRPKMAQIALQYSDYPIFTSDNPRSEDPQKIVDDMLQGISQNSSVKVIIDRRKAIEYAINKAQSGDIVLIAGKGHEDYQIIKGKKNHFDDVEEAERAFKKRGAV
ncbi:UDP-N-acetylmuramoylalanyl-D-glutamate--2,6-diaminopimelate ligase [Liquorilactobacillus aquaticus DSM 21051]|uniref:UDP-N-acetylmuramoyl-L-alanyl-D-glutamate--2,6-diaminopimelate ligase n=1 Tax=Liquorilactobacillus aquaticus DSM 21051 TaxID=1423725 RepID=A0A0R2CZ50_9LACO|nr:UDP-N-acetylmuramoyl-L-alanyl-D-glutamate--2,6-diaminopimelate ligase [Liquorilactobacillus aquaticus]KRM96538.1 UDP-N-acetylmuramoylalanyl-D-glutamate--2,6-diaminopimelate ligase [Liquorilactobacillus aquaticus DSM 21051]